ncbi:cyanophycinase [Maribacter aestuarii]|uniref:cyanophycinase n=1 Tax=Maribacter aestuarii TaxID=1130723 RepID=UPI00248C9B24|nr:cyanophycinase [Maribacter aestuarii]
MIIKYLQILILLFTSAIFYGQNLPGNAVTTGPKKGSLVIAGGGRMGTEITEKFITLAGGRKAPIVVIPTAAGGEIDLENVWFAEQLKNYGATNVHILHTYDKDEADSDSFTKLLKSANAVWFGGGRQWRLVDAYDGTQTEKLLLELLNRGGVIGGTSAGATIQGSYLARGDTKNNQIMMGDHEEGFGYIKNIAIDQHVLARNRQFDMFDILKNRPELLGIGIDESTAIVVQGNEFEVIGESNVLIYDGTFWSREGSDLKTLPKKENVFYFLQSGDRYDMRDRKVITE